jgi:hypothetical protein
LNLNGNSELGDYSLRTLVDFLIRNSCIKVLSIERFKASHGAINTLFESLPLTKIVELNISGIPISYICIEQLCKVLIQSERLELRVLHLRNTKLQDMSALKFMETIIGN